MVAMDTCIQGEPHSAVVLPNRDLKPDISIPVYSNKLPMSLHEITPHLGSFMSDGYVSILLKCTACYKIGYMSCFNVNDLVYTIIIHSSTKFKMHWNIFIDTSD